MTGFELELWWRKTLGEAVVETINKFPDHMVFVGGHLHELEILVSLAAAEESFEFVALAKLLSVAPEVIQWLFGEDWLPDLKPEDV